MDQLCKLQNIPNDPYLILWAILIFLLALSGYIMYLFFKTNRAIWKRIILSATTVIFLLLTSLISTVFLVMASIIPLDDGRPSAPLHQMNAAIKNTCIVDSQKHNCPKTFEDIVKLYPKDFMQLTEKYVFTYQYYPEINAYTLIARPRNMRLHWNKVAVFDPRLEKMDSPFYTFHADFADVPALKCGSKYRLTQPPTFPGPWDEIN